MFNSRIGYFIGIGSERTELISQSGWVLSSATKDLGAPEGTLDLFFFMDEVEKTDVLYFYPNNKTVKTTKIFKSGKIETKPTMKGEWALAADDNSKLIITSGNEVTELKIETLTEDELIVSITEFDKILGKEVKSTFGYKS